MPDEFAEINVETSPEDPELENFAINVLDTGVDVFPADARKFVSSILARKLKFNGARMPARSFAALPVENRLALYQVIARENHEDTLRLLLALNRSFVFCKDFDAAYVKLAEEHAQGFFGDTKKIESLWQRAGNQVCSFGDIMHRFINQPSTATYAEKKTVCEFLVREYAAHNNLDPHRAVFYRGRKLTGAKTWRFDPVVNINTRGDEFIKEAYVLPAIIAHEIEHRIQIQMALDFLLDKIPETSEFFNVAWAMRANLIAPYGYVMVDDSSQNLVWTVMDYMEQPSECGARVAEEYVKKLVLKNWQHKPSAG